MACTQNMMKKRMVEGDHKSKTAKVLKVDVKEHMWWFRLGMKALMEIRWSQKSHIYWSQSYPSTGWSGSSSSQKVLDEDPGLCHLSFIYNSRVLLHQILEDGHICAIYVNGWPRCPRTLNWRDKLREEV